MTGPRLASLEQQQKREPHVSGKTDEGARSFARFVEGLGDGDMLADTSEALHKLSSALQDHALFVNDKAKGTMTIKIKASCDPRGVMGFDYDVEVKTPKRKRAPAQAWVTKGGNVQFENPRQPALPFVREVSIKREERDVDDGAERQVREV